MSKRILSLILFAASLAAFGAFAAAESRDKGDFGLGLILGDPAGINMKYWTGRTTALSAAFAWSVGDEKDFLAHVDCLFHDFGLFKVKSGLLGAYYGVGARLRTNEKTRIGIRIPLGVNYIFERAPVEVFFEVAPLLDVIPKTEGDVQGGVGVRLYF